MRSGDTGCNLPVNLRRLIENAQRKFSCRPHKRGPTGGAPCLLAGPPRPAFDSEEEKLLCSPQLCCCPARLLACPTCRTLPHLPHALTRTPHEPA
jgi:hypothetical protein